MHQQLNYPFRNYPGLFHDVQLAGLFPDSKFFVDATPTIDPETVEKRYFKAKEGHDFDLRTFVQEHFTLPEDTNNEEDLSAGKSIRRHITDLWDLLTVAPAHETLSRYSNLIQLPYRSIIPGGRFREMFYWDTYFTMLGLKESGAIDLLENQVNNFAYLIRTFGFIPNGMRTYFLSRSQPPFFSLMVELLASIKGNAVLLNYLDALSTEYNFWMTGERLVDLTPDLQLNRYWDNTPEPRPESYKEDLELAERSSRTDSQLFLDLRAACESGWDFSSRWLTDPNDLSTIRTTQLLPVDLNCLLYHLEKTLAQASQLQQHQQAADRYTKAAKERKTAIQNLFWSSKHQWFMDVELETKLPANQLTLAGAFPLFLGIATQDQAEQAGQTIRKTFLKEGGLLTTTIRSGQQWDAPNGWAPLQWVTYKGCSNYGLDNLALDIAHRWTRNVERVYEKSGKLVEKYNVENTQLEAGGGEYPNQDGFGWSNGVYLALVSK